MDWIISLVAVLVSLATIIISYFTNRENLKNASQNMISEHVMEFRIAVWNDIISLSDKLVLETAKEHLEKSVNLAMESKKTERGDGEVLGVLQEECEQVRSTAFHLRTKITTIDENGGELTQKIGDYCNDVLKIYEELQSFYIAEKPRSSQFDSIVERIEEFEERNLNFSNIMQKYIVDIQSKLFSNERGKN